MMRDTIYLGAVVFLALVVTSGCATRGSVRALEEQMQQVRGLEGQLQQQGQQLQQQGQQLQQQGQQLQQQAQRVDTEAGRVSGLGQRLDDVDGRLGRLARHDHVTNVVESLDVRFASGRATLDDAGITRLRSLAREVRSDRRLGLELVGYTDPRGSREKNLELSQRRVEAVRRYLIEQGVPVSRIAAVGLGPLSQPGPNAEKRRVTINLTVPEVMTSAAPAGQAPAAAVQDGGAALPGRQGANPR
jgi:outer membrane protein OmpA-like peptidoglycan-associated protein